MTKRWRETHPKGRNLQRKVNYDKGATFNINSGKVYEDIETQMIVDKVLIDRNGTITEKSATDREIAKLIGRTVRAVQAHRTIIKKKIHNEA